MTFRRVGDQVEAQPEGQVAYSAHGGTPQPEQPSMLAEAYASELAALRAQAHADGFEQGRREGLTDAHAQVQAERERARSEAEQVLAGERAALARTGQALTAAVAAVEAVRVPSAEEMTATLAVSAFSLAEAIIGRDLDVSVCAAADAVTRAARLCPSDGPVTVRVHPDDVDGVRTYGDALDDRFVLVADATIEPGGAVASFGSTEVDAQISGALARAKAALHA